MPSKPPPPPDEEYFGHDASKASLTLMEELGEDDPMRCNFSLLLPAERELELEPLRKIRDWLWVIFYYLSIVLIASGLLLRLADAVNKDLLKPYEDGLFPTFMAAMIFWGLYFAVMKCYLRWRVSEHIRHARKQHRDDSSHVSKFSVYVTAPWVYEHASGNHDSGLAFFDPINHILIIEGMNYRYFIHQADITKLAYLSDWGLVRDVYINVTINAVPFELVLSRYSVLEDLPAALLPYLVTRRLIKLTRETLGSENFG